MGVLSIGAQMTHTAAHYGQTHLPRWAAGFVMLVCVAVLTLSVGGNGHRDKSI